ncbi:MAG: zf-HC2 domain-containing protein [Planctomycetota bacterium]|jgi:anti-sigma factor RsiW
MGDVHPNPLSDPGRPDDGGCPPRLELAAYVDGRLSPEAARAVDSHLERCEACLWTVSEVRAVLAEAPPEVPAPVMAAARDVVQPPALGSSDRAWWRRGGVATVGRWAAAVAAAVAVSLAGYHAGTSAPAGAGDADLTAELTFGVIGGDPLAEVELELLAMGVRP